MILQTPFARINLASTHIIDVTGINLRRGEHNAGISDDKGRVNNATPTVKETTIKEELSWVPSMLVFQLVPGFPSPYNIIAMHTCAIK